MAYVYLHKTKDTNVIFYVGIGSDKNYNRAYFFKKRSNKWNGVYNNHPIEVEIVYDNLSWEEACCKEKELIKEYGRLDLNAGSLVNMTDGGEGLYNPSDEVRQKLRYEKSEEHKQFMRSLQKGVKQTPEHIEKRLASKFHNSPEYIEKQKNAHLGRQHSDESKQKMRKPKKPLTQEHREKISKANKGRPSKIKGVKKSRAWQREVEIKELRNQGWSIEKLRIHFKCAERIILKILSN